MTALTGKDLAVSFGLFFQKDDVVGIKINPVGAGLISTRLEVVDAIIDWLAAGGLPRRNIVVWDRFDYMVKDAGFTPERFPGVSFEGLQTMDEAAAEGKAKDNSRWLRPTAPTSASIISTRTSTTGPTSRGPRTRPISTSTSSTESIPTSASS